MRWIVFEGCSAKKRLLLRFNLIFETFLVALYHAIEFICMLDDTRGKFIVEVIRRDKFS